MISNRLEIFCDKIISLLSHIGWLKVVQNVALNYMMGNVTPHLNFAMLPGSFVWLECSDMYGMVLPTLYDGETFHRRRLHVQSEQRASEYPCLPGLVPRYQVLHILRLTFVVENQAPPSEFLELVMLRNIFVNTLCLL